MGDIYRPWPVLSDDSHPSGTDECVAVGLTTTPHTEGIQITRTDWAAGGTPQQSYVSPWYCTTIKFADFDRHQGTLETALTERVATELGQYIGITVER